MRWGQPARLWRMALAGAVLVGCRPTVDAPASGGATSGATSSSTHGDASSSSSGSSAGGETSSGEPQLDGPGCGAPPACDRGTYEGHIRIESAADLAAVEGFTEVAGVLEIMDSADLVCLDTLACLEVVGRDVRIQNNGALRSTAGLGALSTVGRAGGGGHTVAGDIIVAHNAVLEHLTGFSVRDVYKSVLILENPLLRGVSGFRELRTLGALQVTSNPELESIAGLHGVEDLDRCYVSFNESLCSDEALAVCGDLQAVPRGAAAYNDPGCPALPPGTFSGEGEWECDLFADDCPPGNKCTPISTNGGSHNAFACRPVVDEPGAPRESCSVLGEPGEGLDTCERHAMCIDATCVPMCRGSNNGFACLSTQEQCDIDASGVLALCLHICDPLARDCADNEGCFLHFGVFRCLESMAGPGRGGSAAPCQLSSACEPGLVCLGSQARSDCAGTSSGCCSEVCDVGEASCPAGLECAGFYEPWPWFPADVPRHLENVGVCVDPP